MNLRLTYGPWGETLDEHVAAARSAEDGEFEVVWTPELHRSAWVPATAMAAATRRVEVATGIAYAFPRSAMVTALHALDLDDLSGGRFILGLGTGVRRLIEGWHDATFGSPAAHLRETVDVIRRFISMSHTGEPITFEGDWVNVDIQGYERPFQPVRESVPIYIGSVGPVLTRTAGEIADGWIAHELGSPAYLEEKILPNLEEGMSRVGRDRSEVTRVVSACCVPYQDAAQARRWAAGLVAFYASVRTYTDFFAWHGFEDEARRIQERFREGDEAGMIDACTDEMVETFTFAGTPDDVRRQIRVYDGLADAIKLTPPTHLVDAEVTRLSQEQILTLWG